MIKPEGICLKKNILRYFKESFGNKAVNVIYKMILSVDDIKVIYQGDSHVMLQAHKNHFVGKEVIVGIIKVPSFLALRKVVGPHFIPARCEDGSVRSWFKKSSVIKYGDIHYYANGVHFAANDNDNGIQLLWFKDRSKHMTM